MSVVRVRYDSGPSRRKECAVSAAPRPPVPSVLHRNKFRRRTGGYVYVYPSTLQPVTSPGQSGGAVPPQARTHSPQTGRRIPLSRASTTNGIHLNFALGLSNELGPPQWYAVEHRDPAPFLCTYMGRTTGDRTPFRVIRNHSRAIATNVYLMLYPKEPLRLRMSRDHAAGRVVFDCLTRIVASEWKANGRVYGGGLYKLEPRELGRLDAAPLMDAFPELRSAAADQPTLWFDR